MCSLFFVAELSQHKVAISAFCVHSAAADSLPRFHSWDTILHKECCLHRVWMTVDFVVQPSWFQHEDAPLHTGFVAAVSSFRPAHKHE